MFDLNKHSLAPLGTCILFNNSLYSLFESHTHKRGSHPIVRSRKADKRTGKVYSTISFKGPGPALMFPCLNMFHDMFYKDGTKIVPSNIGDMLNARALGIMDDGSKGSYGETILHTRAFRLQDVKLLQSALMNNFGLVTRLYEKTPGQWVIIIPVKQVTQIKDIVAQYSPLALRRLSGGGCVSMLYKL